VLLADYSSRLRNVKRVANLLIYASVLLGILLLAQLYSIVPDWLFYSVLTGWTAYLIVAVLIARHFENAYPIALLLAILTLIVSLPQPEHQNMVLSGFSLGTITFLSGSILQLGVIASIAYYLLRTHSRTFTTSD
jgi:hypothetical protein